MTHHGRAFRTRVDLLLGMRYVGAIWVPRLIIAAALVFGVMVGIGMYTFVYAKGYS